MLELSTLKYITIVYPRMHHTRGHRPPTYQYRSLDANIFTIVLRADKHHQLSMELGLCPFNMPILRGNEEYDIQRLTYNLIQHAQIGKWGNSIVQISNAQSSLTIGKMTRIWHLRKLPLHLSLVGCVEKSSSTM